MDRGWYFRFALMLALTTGAWFTLWPTLDEWVPAPSWVKEYFGGEISPGLDIQGGLRLVYEVDVDEAIKNRRDLLADRLVPQLGELLGVLEGDEVGAPTREQLDSVRERVRVRTVGEQRLRVEFTEGADAEQLERDWLRERFEDLIETSRSEENGAATVNLRINEEFLEQLAEDAVERARKTVDNRVNALGVSDLNISKNGTNLIVEIPGGDDRSRLVSYLLAGVTGAAPGEDGFRIPFDAAAAAQSTGLREAVVRETLDGLLEETWVKSTDSEGNQDREPILRADGDHVVITNVEELKQRSTFERVRNIISRTARLDFKVVEHENTFFRDLSAADKERAQQAGIEIRPRTAYASPTREVTEYFLFADGDGALDRLREFVSSIEGQIPDDREVLFGKTESRRSEESDAAPTSGEAWRGYLVFATTEVTGEDVKDAYVSTDQQQRPVVILEFNSDGADAWARLTGANVQREVAIVLDNMIESAPVIQDRIGGGVTQITLGGYRSYDQLSREAAELVVVLKAGALPAPIRPINEQLIGPTLGRDSVERGAQGALIGVLLVLVFMLMYYQVAGIVADAMVLLNLLFLLASLAFLGQYFSVTLTLPGIAGIALTIGMAVDANVLITERIREELRLGKSPRSAVDQGFKRAFWSIFDAQFTTFIAGVVLFQYGTGPIKGFAVTLMIGIATSLFTGVFCSKVMLDWIVRGLRVQRLRVG